MKTVAYDGPHDRVEIPLPSGVRALCDRGGTVQLPDEIADRIAEQDGWTLVVPAAPARAAAKAKTTTEEDPDADR